MVTPASPPAANVEGAVPTEQAPPATALPTPSADAADQTAAEAGVSATDSSTSAEADLASPSGTPDAGTRESEGQESGATQVEVQDAPSPATPSRGDDSPVDTSAPGCGQRRRTGRG